jgi:hypothetical protein
MWILICLVILLILVVMSTSTCKKHHHKKRSCLGTPPSNCLESYCDKNTHTWICTSCIDGYNTPESNCTNNDNTDLTFRRNRYALTAPYIKNVYNSRPVRMRHMNEYMYNLNRLNNSPLGAYADYIDNNSNYSIY